MVLPVHTSGKNGGKGGGKKGKKGQNGGGGGDVQVNLIVDPLSFGGREEDDDDERVDDVELVDPKWWLEGLEDMMRERRKKCGG